MSRCRILRGFCAALCLGLAAQTAAGTEPPLRLGVFAYLGVEETTAKYAPLGDYLRGALGRDVVLSVLPQEELCRRVDEGQLDFVTTNPTHYLAIRKRHALSGVIATLAQACGQVPCEWLGGVILVDAGRQDLQRLEDLRRCTVAAPSRQNMGAYRTQAYELLQAGVPPDQYRLLETGQMREAALAVFDGRADAAFLRDGILEKLLADGSLRPERVRLLNEKTSPAFPHRLSTRLYPEWPVFALSHVDARTIRQVGAALLSLEPDHPAAVAAGIYGYSIPADYRVVEEMSRALRLPPYDQAPEFSLQDVWQRWAHSLAVLALAIALAMAALAWALVASIRARRGRRQMHRILSALGEGVIGVDVNDVCVFCNQAALEMLGLKESELIGQPQHEVFHYLTRDGQPHPPEACPVVCTARDGQPRTAEEWFLRSSGEGFPVHLVVTPMLAGRRPAGAVAAFHDISARKRAEDLITAKNRELERVIYVASHDLRSPLVNVDGYGRELETALADVEAALRDRSVLNPEETAFLKELLPEMALALHHIRGGTRQMDSLLKGLLDVSRRGRAVLRIEKLDMDALLGQVLAAMHFQIQAAGADVQVAPLPPCRADATQLAQVFANLLGNALKFLDPARPGRIRIDAASEYGRCVYCLHDNGVGIAPGDTDKIFDLFHRLNPDGPEGDGLGLPVARQILGRLDGEIWVESVPGEGSRFYVSLPRER